MASCNTNQEAKLIWRSKFQTEKLNKLLKKSEVGKSVIVQLPNLVPQNILVKLVLIPDVIGHYSSIHILEFFDQKI